MAKAKKSAPMGDAINMHKKLAMGMPVETGAGKQAAKKAPPKKK